MLIRKQVGETESYRGRAIIARFCGPDLLCEVDGEEIGGFYLNREAVINAAKRYIDAIEKAKEDKSKKRKRSVRR